MCGRECGLPAVRLNSAERYVCPLTHIVVEPGDEVQTPLFDANGRCCNHWSVAGRVTPKRVAKAAKAALGPGNTALAPAPAPARW